MPLYMDIHKLPEGATADDVGKAHDFDVATQEKYGVKYHKYWLNEGCDKVFCLVDAPNAEAAVQVHQEAHGLVAEKLIEVESDLAEAFLGGGKVNAAGAALMPGEAGDVRDPGTRTVLFTDIVDSTVLTQEVGDEVAMELVKVHDKIVRNALAASGGREVKHTGDGMMVVFVSAAAAIKCATQIQREICKYREEHPESPLKLRIGVAAGEPVEHANDLFGSTVQLAARLCSHAQPEQIVVSNVVAELCVGKRVPLQDLGKVTLKGFDRPLRVHVVAWPEEAPASASSSPTG